MRLAQDDEMVNTLAPDRSDQPFGKAILLGRGWYNWLVSDAVPVGNLIWLVKDRESGDAAV